MTERELSKPVAKKPKLWN